MTERKEDGWFYAKRYGYGTGLPRTWQGWLVTALFIALILIGAAFIAPLSQLAFIAYVIPLTLAFLVIAAKTTSGGWKWRWGKDREGGTW
ncbi:hypothetical protein [Sphingomicrobium sediminis]|uniref:Uncharacterized protein n=1 Tax=Sphingomicrobium sediminis TaxID=2950949 RepID=A0A9X2J3L7_9SPHN|nr:hypothetical protein [Sphingomicrobium sediminis]MCM8558175.1 hypothetical protein [Sphingomicrobium sediminis]